jgi:VIT1/CCC1 family predicted Fe2+/Mn2+ transporter
MNALNDTTTTPARTGLRLIAPWGLRHLRAVAGIRFAVGALLTVIASVLITRGYAAPGAVLLAVAVLHFSWGSWQLTIARSGRPHPSGR